MSVDIKIGSESLDLADVQLDITEENPFLQLSEKQQGEYSLPFEVALTDTNNRLLKFAGQLQKRKSQDPTGAIVYENGIQHSQGNLNLESLDSNLNRSADGAVSLYYTFGLGSFFNLIKDKRLPQVDFGAPKQFAWDGANYSGAGFWAHVHQVLHAPDPLQYDYAFFPAKNLQDDAGTNFSVYNTVFRSAGPIPYDTHFFELSQQRIVPFPYLKNVLLKTFAWLGWSVDGAMLNDPEFEKIVLLNAYFISWFSESQNAEPILIDLALHVPDVLISTFLLGLRVRFGWWFDFDFHKKKCTIRYLKDVYALRNRIEQTLNTSAPYKIQIEKDKKTYSLQGSQESEPVQLQQLKYQGTIANKFSLPAATSARADQVYFVAGENNFYTCMSDDENDSSFSWQLLASNAAAYQPAGFNDTITTACNVPTMTEHQLYNLPGVLASGRLLLVPQFSAPVNNEEAEDFFICYAHGDVLCYTAAGIGDLLYPYGSPHNYAPGGNKLSGDVLTWEMTDHVTAAEIGIAARYWKDFLKYFVQVEVATFIFYLPFDQVQKLSWIDSHIIRNTEWIIKTRRRVLPYSGFIEATCIRI